MQNGILMHFYAKEFMGYYDFMFFLWFDVVNVFPVQPE